LLQHPAENEQNEGQTAVEIKRVYTAANIGSTLHIVFDVFLSRRKKKNEKKCFVSQSKHEE